MTDTSSSACARATTPFEELVDHHAAACGAPAICARVRENVNVLQPDMFGEI
jgi:hypothetical protein